MNVILGIAYNCDETIATRFVKSLKRCNVDAKLIVFTYHVTDGCIQFLNDNGCETIQTHIYNAKWHINHNRQLNYLKYVNDNYDKLNYVMEADLRDIIFQDDPFKDIDYDIAFGIECADHKIKDCTYNARWIKEHIVPDVYDEFSEYTISCAGCTIGTKEAMLKYLNYYTDPDNVFSEYNDADQGHHNYIIRRYDFGKVRMSTNDVGPIGTFGKEYYTTLSVIDGKVCYKNMPPLPVIHQFDRFPHVEEEIKKIYDI